MTHIMRLKTDIKINCKVSKKIAKVTETGGFDHGIQNEAETISI